MIVDIDWHAIFWAALMTYLMWPRLLEFGRGLREGWNEANQERPYTERRD